MHQNSILHKRYVAGFSNVSVMVKIPIVKPIAIFVMAVALILAGPVSVMSTVGATPVAGFIRLRERKGGGQTVVPIDDETIYAIKRYQFINVDSDSPYLFTSNLGGRLSKERIRREVKAAADRAGVATKDADDEAQLLAVKLDEAPTTEGANTSDIPGSLGDVLANNSNITSSELLDGAEGVGAISDEGELNASYTPRVRRCLRLRPGDCRQRRRGAVCI